MTLKKLAILYAALSPHLRRYTCKPSYGRHAGFAAVQDDIVYAFQVYALRFQRPRRELIYRNYPSGRFTLLVENDD